MKRRYDAVFFDMGHTLVEFAHDEQGRADALRPLGFAGTAGSLAAAMDDAITARSAALEKLMDTVDQSGYVAVWSDIYRLAMRAVGFSGDEDRAVQALWDHWLYDAWRVYPEVLRVLDQLAASGYTIGIISNWAPTLDATCERLGLTSRCPLIVCSAVVGYAKPDRHIFEHALQRAGVDAARALHVGDNFDADVLGALSVGMSAVHLVRDGSDQASADVRSQTDDTVPTVRTLTELLDELR